MKELFLREKETFSRIVNSTVSTEKAVLIVRKWKLGKYYYKRENGVETYLGKGKEHEIRRLEEELYLKRLNSTVRDNEALCEKILSLLEKMENPEDVFFSLPEEKRHLIKPYSVPVDEDYVTKWCVKPSIRKELEETPYITSFGLKVRSKSELIIAERLQRKNIPFHYEFPTYINRRPWFVDFLVLNKRTKKEYYWEHFGRMDDPNYQDNVLGKLEKYAKHGIILGKNLIITMESSEHPLNTEYLDILIDQHFI